MGLSTYLRNKILDAVFRNTSLAIAVPYISLHDGDPGDNGANELSGGSYVRGTVGFDAAASAATSNTDALAFTGLPGATITHLAVWDAESGGNFAWGGALTAPKTVAAGDGVTFSAGELDAALT